MSDRSIGLTAAGSSPLDAVGGKARTLGQLKAAGFNVPDGFVVAPRTPLDEIEDSLTGNQLDGPFAVRSSGVTEDGNTKSLAGRYLSMLNVESGVISAAVKQVRSVARDKDGVEIPVLVQEMVDAECAGVAFSADPVTGDRTKAIVTGSSGLADRLVSGELAGDEWVIASKRATARRRPEGAISRRLALKVAGLTVRIAEELGGPQDVEWAWDGKKLWVVQARPITSLPPDVDWTPPVRGIYHRSLRFGEWLPGPVTPLCESWLLTNMERQVHEYLRELIGQIAPEPHHVVVNGWYFYSLNWLPVPGVALLRNFISIVPRLPRNWRSAAGMFPQTIRFAAGGFEESWREQLLPEYRQLVSDAEHRMPELDAGQLVEMVDRLADAAGRYFGSIAVVSGAAYKFEAQLAQFWNKHLRDDLGVSHMVVLQGFEQAAVTSKTPRLETLDWSRPAMPPAAPSGHLDRLRSQRQDFELRALSHLEDSPRKLAKFRRLLADAQHQMPIREEQISQLGIAWPPMRLAIQRIAETLVAMNSIASVEDVYLLSKDEVLSLLDSPNDMSKAVNQRHLHLEEASRLVPPLTVGQVPLAVKFLFSMSERIQGAQHDPAALVHGTPASPGRATGKVRIIRNSSQFEAFQEGEILVAPLTAPAWTDLFDRAAAVVTDVGSALAHASIIAREYGIPAVVGCGDATARLVDGQVITVDGSTGNVEPGAGGGHDQ